MDQKHIRLISNWLIPKSGSMREPLWDIDYSHFDDLNESKTWGSLEPRSQILMETYL